MLIEYQITTTGQCHSIESVPKNARIVCIDGKDFIAMCENCGKPILDGDKYHVDEEGVYICIPCGNQLFEAEKAQENKLGLEEQPVVKFACGFCGAPLDEKGNPIKPVPEGYNPENYEMGACRSCAESENRSFVVTREMALDAGDPSLEEQAP